MRCTLSTLVLLLMGVASYAQQSVSLQSLMDSAVVHYPVHATYMLNQDLEQNHQQQLQRQNLPSVQLSGKVSWQSEVIELPISLPGVDLPSMSQDQYQLNLEVQQPLYQGGLIRTKQQLEQFDKAIRDAETSVSLYTLRQQVASTYLQLMLNHKQQEVLNLHRQTIRARQHEMEALVRKGVLLQQSVDYLMAELLDLDQQSVQLSSERITFIQELNTLCGTQLDTTFVPLPELMKDVAANQIQRKELELFHLQKEKLETSGELVSVQNRPQVYAYASAGYGRPGLNYLSDEFADYYMLGVRFSWKIWDWKQGHLQREELRIQQGMLQTQEDAFRQQVQIAANKLEEEMRRIKAFEQQDIERIKLRESIAETAAQQLRNGTLTSADYLEELNKLKQARLEPELHTVQYMLAQVNYLWIKGLL